MNTEFKSIWSDVYDHEEQAKLLEQMKAEVRHDKIAKAIMLALYGVEEGMTKAELQDKVACRKQRFLQTLKQLTELGKIHKTSIGKKTKPFLYRTKPWT